MSVREICAPSAITMTAWLELLRRVTRCSHSSRQLKGSSGMRQTLTSRAASDALTAMKPAWRPMSLTMPMPLCAASASVCAQLMGRTACSTAVSKPNDLSMMGMSLSMVFGTATTASFTLFSMAPLKIDSAPRWLPSPPITYSWLMPYRSSPARILSTLKPPRDVPSTVPPRMCMEETVRGSSSMYAFSYVPRKPFGTPQILRTPYEYARHITSSRMTVLRPGHRPPHVTMAARTSDGRHRTRSYGPATRNRRRTGGGAPRCVFSMVGVTIASFSPTNNEVPVHCLPISGFRNGPDPESPSPKYGHSCTCGTS
mmetsp:Transcript_6825/g.24278  ORF Transcript_6825/g.24278 Transcript_6825/m.24278 type:complete len:313 (-) Transcript_6825:436-1374(-)